MSGGIDLASVLRVAAKKKGPEGPLAGEQHRAQIFSI
jgi:hypothetical protein